MHFHAGCVPSALSHCKRLISALNVPEGDQCLYADDHCRASLQAVPCGRSESQPFADLPSSCIALSPRCCCTGERHWHKSALALHQALTALAPHHPSRGSIRLHSNSQHQSLASSVFVPASRADDDDGAAGSGQVPVDEQGLLSGRIPATKAAAAQGFYFAKGLLGIVFSYTLQ